MTNIKLLLSVVLISFAFQCVSFAEERLSSIDFLGKGASESETGHTTLEWKNDNEQVLTLELSLSKDFSQSQELYTGKNKSFFISGLEDGYYYFRLLDLSKSVHDQTTLYVKHHSVKYSLVLFAIGFVLFGSIVIVIAKGSAHE